MLTYQSEPESVARSCAVSRTTAAFQWNSAVAPAGGNTLLINTHDSLPAIHFASPLCMWVFQKMVATIRQESYRFVPEGDVLRILVHAWDHPTEHYFFEMFFNPTDAKTCAALRVLTHVDRF
jgi:hypothetical protein